VELVGAGKGPKYRPVNRKAWEAGWERCFGKRSRSRVTATRGPHKPDNRVQLPAPQPTKG